MTGRQRGSDLGEQVFCLPLVAMCFVDVVGLPVGPSSEEVGTCQSEAVFG
jgi:hypothetical protein